MSPALDSIGPNKELKLISDLIFSKKNGGRNGNEDKIKKIGRQWLFFYLPELD